MFFPSGTLLDACRYGIRVLLALGNLWPAYFGPERWLLMAKGSSGTGLHSMPAFSTLPLADKYWQVTSTFNVACVPHAQFSLLLPLSLPTRWARHPRLLP